MNWHGLEGSYAGLLDLGFYPKNLGLFEGDGIFLGNHLFENSLGINLGNYRRCSATLLVDIFNLLQNYSCLSWY